MNTIGRIFRVSVLGESHGGCVGVLVDGCPAGLEISPGIMEADLGRRRGGGRGATARREADVPIIKSGVFNGKSTGAPILVLFENRDMDSSEYEKTRDAPRPSHADLSARQKYGGFNDYRGGGHFSGRLTAGLVAAGAVAKKLLGRVKVEARVLEAGGSADINDAVGKARKEGDSVGGIVECRISGIPPGLGEPFFDSAESLLGHVAFSIPAVKGVEFGAGFAGAGMRGSAFNDSIVDREGKTATNNSGGINGGITNGNEIVFRVAIRPTASIPKEQKTVDLKSGRESTISVSGRHDACIALRVPVVLEAVSAIVLADLMLIEQKIKRVIE